MQKLIQGPAGAIAFILLLNFAYDIEAQACTDEQPVITIHCRAC